MDEIHHSQPDETAAGTVLPARRDGFLCVISLLSTFLRPFVMSEPRFNSANTAATPPPLAAGAAGAAAAGGGGGGGGPGGGGGGGALAAAGAAAPAGLYWLVVTP